MANARANSAEFDRQQRRPCQSTPLYPYTKNGLSQSGRPTTHTYHRSPPALTEAKNALLASEANLAAAVAESPFVTVKAGRREWVEPPRDAGPPPRDRYYDERPDERRDYERRGDEFGHGRMPPDRRRDERRDERYNERYDERQERQEQNNGSGWTASHSFPPYHPAHPSLFDRSPGHISERPIARTRLPVGSPPTPHARPSYTEAHRSLLPRQLASSSSWSGLGFSSSTPEPPKTPGRPPSVTVPHTPQSAPAAARATAPSRVRALWPESPAAAPAAAPRATAVTLPVGYNGGGGGSEEDETMAVRTADAAARHLGEGLTLQRPACSAGRRDACGAKAGEEAHEEERLRQLQEILSAWPAFGLFSLFATHPLVTRGVSGLPWWRAVCLKLAPLLLVATQLVAPPLLLVTLAAGGEGGWCPATAPPVDRCLTCAVALLALARCWSGAYAHAHAHAHAHTHAHAPPQRDGREVELGAASVRVHAARRRRREESGLERSLLGEVGRLDAALQPSLAALASLAGLALAYAAQGAASILLCVLSAEVFAQLGGQYKA